MVDFGAVADLRRSMAAGEKTIHDRVAMCTRTIEQHRAAIQRAKATATREWWNASEFDAEGQEQGTKRSRAAARKRAEAAAAEHKRLVQLLFAETGLTH